MMTYKYIKGECPAEDEVEILIKKTAILRNKEKAVMQIQRVINVDNFLKLNPAIIGKNIHNDFIELFNKHKHQVLMFDTIFADIAAGDIYTIQNKLQKVRRA